MREYGNECDLTRKTRFTTHIWTSENNRTTASSVVIVIVTRSIDHLTTLNLVQTYRPFSHRASGVSHLRFQCAPFRLHFLLLLLKILVGSIRHSSIKSRARSMRQFLLSLLTLGDIRRMRRAKILSGTTSTRIRTPMRVVRYSPLMLSFFREQSVDGIESLFWTCSR